MGRISAVTRSYIFLLREYLHIHKQTRGLIKREISLGNKEIGLILKDRKTRARVEQYITYCQLLGQAVFRMYGRRMSTREETRFFYLSLLGPVFDDFFDSESLNPDIINSMVMQPEDFVPSSRTEKIFIYYLKKIYQTFPNPDGFRRASLELFNAQLESKKQSDHTLSRDTIQFISMNKGGLAGILYSQLLDKSTDQGEKDIYYQVGMLGQFVDDIFDYYDDWNDGIRNSANCLEDLSFIRPEFEQLVRDTVGKIRQLPYRSEYIDQFLNLLNLLISPVWVCLARFDHLTSKYGNGFCLEHIQRKEMICDMEKWNNRISLYFKSIHYYPSILG